MLEQIAICVLHFYRGLAQSTGEEESMIPCFKLRFGCDPLLQDDEDLDSWLLEGQVPFWSVKLTPKEMLIVEEVRYCCKVDIC